MRGFASVTGTKASLRHESMGREGALARSEPGFQVGHYSPAERARWPASPPQINLAALPMASSCLP